MTIKRKHIIILAILVLNVLSQSCFTSNHLFPSSGETKSKTIVILVPESLYTKISIHLDRYADDIQLSLGVNVEIQRGSWKTSQDVRTYLQSLFASKGLDGCILVGDIPWANYEMVNPWGGYEYFPCDLYYMDLNGEFTDIDGNGYYDKHAGNASPEIWTARIKASNMGAEEVALLENYFDRNHNYRQGFYDVSSKALIYVDDDWFSSSSYIESEVAKAYDERKLVNENETTCKSNYLNDLQYGYEFLWVQVHGWENGHSFKVHNGQDWETVSWNDIRDVSPKTVFYILSSCTVGRYSEKNYIAGWYIFSEQGYGLTCIASTRTGGFGEGHILFQGLRNGKWVGEAFREWIDHEMDIPDLEWCSHGYTIIGDPTLKILGMSISAPNQAPTAYIDSISPNPAYKGQTVSFSGHGTDPNGSIVAYEWSSSIDAFLSSSNSFSSSALSIGTHTIHFKVKDDDGTWSTEATATLTITAQGEEKRCIIATATYGSELAPEVQFLRGFRDNIVLSTFAGSQFMRVFNAWYYSFSPSVAFFIAQQPVATTIMRGVLYPLIGILHLSSMIYSVFSFSPEVGVVVAGLVASSLIGVVYFTLPATVLLSIIKRLKKKMLKTVQLKLLSISWLISVALMLLGEITLSPAIMMTATASFVLTTLVSLATVIANKIMQRFL